MLTHDAHLDVLARLRRGELLADAERSRLAAVARAARRSARRPANPPTGAGAPRPASAGGRAAPPAADLPAAAHRHAERVGTTP